MQLETREAVQILQGQVCAVEVKDDGGFVRCKVSPAAAALNLESGNYVAIGNRKRIRFIRPLGSNMTLAALRNGSRTVRRITGAQGQIIAPHWVVEHR